MFRSSFKTRFCCFVFVAVVVVVIVVAIVVLPHCRRFTDVREYAVHLLDVDVLLYSKELQPPNPLP